MVDAKSEHVPCSRRLLRGSVGREVRLRGEREVDLKAVPEQEDPVQRRRNREVEQVRRAELIGQLARPILHDLRNARALADPESQVDVGPAIRLTASVGTDQRTGNNARV
jgi:hypothetical protein